MWDRHIVSVCQSSFGTFVAIRARPVWWAEAAVPVDLVHAGGPEGTRGRLALVDVCQRRRTPVKKDFAPSVPPSLPPLPPRIKEQSQTENKHWAKR